MNLIDQVPTFEKGESVTSETFRRKLNGLSWALKESILNNGVGYNITRFGNGSGTSLNIRQSTKGSSSTANNRFIVNLSGDKISVGEGSLFKSIYYNDTIEVEGLGVEYDVSSVVSIELEITSMAVTRASIKSGEWSDYPDPILIENAQQTRAFIILATITDGVLSQVIDTNLILKIVCYRGSSAIYVAPWINYVE